MINWKELEKFVAPGKVVTLVIMIDGKELGALSFNLDTLAYKEILEVAKQTDPPVIAEKPKEVKKETPSNSPAKNKTKTTPVKEEPLEKVDFDTEGEEDLDEEENEDENQEVDEETGEIKETFVEKTEKKIGAEMVKGQQEVILAGNPPVNSTQTQPLTREEIMNSPVVDKSGPAKEDKKEEKSLFDKEEW